jgi:uncharacterized protein
MTVSFPAAKRLFRPSGSLKRGAAASQSVRKTGVGLVPLLALLALALLAAGLAGCSSSPSPAASAASPVPDPDKAPVYYRSACFDANDRRFVFDYTDTMGAIAGTGSPYGAEVEAAACALYQEDGAHLVLVLVPSLGGHTIDDYAVDLVRAWGLGDAKRLDGLLVLYAKDDGSGHPATRVEVGYGLEGTVNALAARQAVDSMQALHGSLLENGTAEPDATAHALAAGTIGLADFTRTNLAGVPQPGGSDGAGPGIPTWVIAVVVVVALLALLGRRGRGSGFLGGLILGGMMRGGRGGGGWGGGGGSGRGGGGFGGGKSGGGGWGGRF